MSNPHDFEGSKHEVKNINEAFWWWMETHAIDLLRQEDAPRYTYKKSGVISNSKPFFSESEHFFDYISRGSFKREFARRLSELYDTDVQLYTYIILRSASLSAEEIDELNEREELGFPNMRTGVGKNRRTSDVFKRYNYRALLFFADSFPEGVRPRWGLDELRGRMKVMSQHGSYARTRMRSDQREQMRDSRRVARHIVKQLLRAEEALSMQRHFLDIVRDKYGDESFRAIQQEAYGRAREESSRKEAGG